MLLHREKWSSRLFQNKSWTRNASGPVAEAKVKRWRVIVERKLSRLAPNPDERACQQITGCFPGSVDHPDNAQTPGRSQLIPSTIGGGVEYRTFLTDFLKGMFFRPDVTAALVRQTPLHSSCLTTRRVDVFSLVRLKNHFPRLS